MKTVPAHRPSSYRNSGRRTMLSDELIEKAADFIRRGGLKPLSALVSLGVNRNTAKDWLRLGYRAQEGDWERGGHTTYPNEQHLKLVNALDQALEEWHRDTVIDFSESKDFNGRSLVLKARFHEYRERSPDSDPNHAIVSLFQRLAERSGVEVHDDDHEALPSGDEAEDGEYREAD